MTSTAEEDLLRMSITGSLPPSAQPSFDSAKTLGNTAFKEGRYDDAVRCYTDAEQINPLSPVPPANRAMAYLKLEQFQKAKADAAVALELYNALPKDAQPPGLPTKILLRRATANVQLLLYALAAEDYASVLQLDARNEAAKEGLKMLKDEFGVVPPSNVSSARAGSGDGQVKIELLSEQVSEQPKESPREKAHIMRDLNGKVEDETALMELSDSMMNDLISKWSSVPPQSADEFERVWKSLQKHDAARTHYLINTVGADRITDGLLGESLTPQLLEEFVSVLAEAVEKDTLYSAKAANIMCALTRVPRFEMLLMFLSADEKEPIRQLFDALERCGRSTTEFRDKYLS